ncbi:MAG: hypothetical protein WD079_01905 [Phycisphaeraceae bacterium]
MIALLKDRVVLGLLATLVVLTLLELFVYPHSHPYFPWHDWAGYTVLIVIVAAFVVGWGTKALLAPRLQVPEETDE